MIFLVIGAAIGAVCILFLLILIIRALRFTPLKSIPKAQDTITIDTDTIVQRFSKLIQCKTISNRESTKTNIEEFHKVHSLIQEFYPEIFKTCEFTSILDTGLLFKWQGKKSDAPVVLMSHYDVVPASETEWLKPPFAGLVENGELWGRGTLDTKGTFIGILEAVSYHIKAGFIPENDIYLSFSGDEEVAGPTCPVIVDHLGQKGIKPALVLDEGGAVVENVFPGVDKQCALVGIAEKGIMDIRLSLKSSGGHASSPPTHTILGELAQAMVNIENTPFPFRLTPPVQHMFDILGRHSSFAYKLIFANLWLFSPVLNSICKKQGGELNALVRTTTAFTMAEASKASNVLPPEAHITANMRLMKDDPADKAIEYLKKIAKNPRIEFSPIHSTNATDYASIEDPAWQKIEHAIQQTWPKAIVAPYLMLAASDSRHYNAISSNVYKFSAMHLSKEQRGLIHAHNERISLQGIEDIVKFFIRLIASC